LDSFFSGCVFVLCAQGLLFKKANKCVAEKWNFLILSEEGEEEIDQAQR
jgi:hypothetical protein